MTSRTGRSSTDLNGQTTKIDYDAAWRLKSVTSPTGASTLTQFDKDANQNDLLSYFQQVSYREADDVTLKTITSLSWFDGAGRVLRAGTNAGAAPASYDAVKTEYDTMGRVNRQSNPVVETASRGVRLELVDIRLAPSISTKLIKIHTVKLCN